MKSCYPPDAKHRNAPAATKKMHALAEEEAEMHKAYKRKRKRELEESGGGVAAWSDSSDSEASESDCSAKATRGH